jgi:niacin transporter
MKSASNPTGYYATKATLMLLSLLRGIYFLKNMWRNIMSKVKQMAFTGVFIALGILLPVALHSIPEAGRILLPMHLPVLMCGLVCGPLFGLACGILTPLLSSLITGMPPMAFLPAMLCELAIYGLVAGLLIKVIKTKSTVANIYLSLAAAMLCGRIVYGILNAIIFSAGDYSLQIWLTASFITAAPGIIAQLVLIPPIILALRKANLIKL